MLAYGTPADAANEYIRIREITGSEFLENFTTGIIQVFGTEYLWKPTNEDIRRLLTVNSSRGFPGMLGSIDCMHWQWRNCPVA